MKKPKTYFASTPDGTCYVQIRAIMNPMCALIDGLPITQFKKDKQWYMKATEAIAWCQNEAKCHSEKKYATIIAVLEKLITQENERVKNEAPQ